MQFYLHTKPCFPAQLTCLVLLLSLIPIFSVSVAAKENIQFSNADYAQLERDYVSAAFGGGYAQVTKFNNVTPLTRSFECQSTVPEKCLATVSLFRNSVPQTEFFRIAMTEGQTDLRLILAEKQRLLGLREELRGRFPNAIFDNSSADCQLYISIVGAVITSAVTVISVDAEPMRAQTCHFVSLYRSLGLSLNDGKSFSDLWGDESDSGLRPTSRDFEELKYRGSVLLLIHACKRLQLGMTRQEVEIELNPDSVCFNQLKNLSDGP